ncbi:anaerobic ribonucleoside-triphosphate reductase activating protein [Lachnoclostridium phytofermentans]|uniref:anaerobic ribonucleoside-triphosphate reductase activating protein n=1 Tax=Lachnoclostridium phytofermentans TaxID=66219 RepID=UPI000496135B|nr:anaerobic ribonucleoside-triphosphate reductase activating protein [Lachnoclostridium phytofermentans]
MKISGLQKLTLLDYPGHLACTVFTAGCNFRCPFCQNASLVLPSKEISQYREEEILNFLSSRKHILEGLCISGGEPTMQPDLTDFIRKVKSMGYSVKLDTNGTHPKLLRELIEDQLIDMVAMDIKNSKESYPKTSGIEILNINSIEESVDLLKEGRIPYEFRTTIVRELHTKKDMDDIGKWLYGSSPYYLQAFVDSGDLIGTNLTGYSKQELIELLEIVSPYLPNASLRGID